jgi:hypothetical protein
MSVSSASAIFLLGRASAAQQNIASAQIDGGKMSEQLQLAQLTLEYWKLLHAFQRCIPSVPETSQARLAAQARYSGERLTAILSMAGLRLVTFDGLAFEVNLPAVAINAEDFSQSAPAFVERTLEPAVVSDSSVILTGKVFLASEKKD